MSQRPGASTAGIWAISLRGGKERRAVSHDMDSARAERALAPY